MRAYSYASLDSTVLVTGCRSESTICIDDAVSISPLTPQVLYAGGPFGLDRSAAALCPSREHPCTATLSVRYVVLPKLRPPRLFLTRSITKYL